MTSPPSRVCPASPGAMQMGSHAGRMIEGDLRMRSRIPFHYRNKGALATIGRARAVADFGRVRFGGSWRGSHGWPFTSSI